MIIIERIHLSNHLIGIGFGTWAWGNKLIWGYEPDKKDHILAETFKAACAGGLTLIDTADSYGTGSLNGRSETLLGSFMEKLTANEKENIKIATKLAPYPWRLGRKGLRKAFFASKSRLNNHLDRVQLHWSTSRYAPWQEESLIEGLADLICEGFAKEIGVSNVGPKRLELIHNNLAKRGIALASVQIQFSLLSPIDTNILEICKDLNIELLAYSPLALGILAISPENNETPKTYIRRQLFNRLLPQTIRLRQCLNQIAKDKEVSQVEVALNWCRSHEAIPIPGLTTPKQAKEASAALRWTLSNAEKEELDLLSKKCSRLMPQNPFQSS